VHQTSVDRYVRFNEDLWRVVCARCGVLADDLGRYGAGYVESYMAKRECVLPDDASQDRLAWTDSQGHSLSGGHSRLQADPPVAQALASTDEQILSAWRGGMDWPATDVALA
jgi:hypothetical protein